MRFRPGAALTTAVAIGFGIVVLVGLLSTASTDSLPIAATNLILQLVSTTIAVTILIGILNLVAVHLRRIGARSGGWGYSFVVLISALGVIVVTILERAEILQPKAGEPAISTILLETVQISIESALAGLLFFALVYGAARMMRRRVSVWAILFTAALLVVLLGTLPFSGLSRLLDLRDWLLRVPVSAGTRGILLGIALGTVVTGVRVLVGQDRSYRE